MALGGPSFISRVGAPTLVLGFAMMVVLVLAGTFMAEAAAASRLERRAAAEVARTEAIASGATALLTSLVDAETGQRGYLLTARAEFLGPYKEGRRRADAALSQLAQMAPAEPRLALAFPAIARGAGRRLDLLGRVIELDAQGHRREALALMPEGRVLMDDLRLQLSEVIDAADARERAVRAERTAFAERSARLQEGVAEAAALALLIAAVALIHERIASARAEAMRARMTDELEAARVRAVEADAAKSRFLAAASHDMRQPLHALALYISALERRVESPQGREILASMDDAVRTMSRLFTALLDLARLEAGILKPEPIIFELGELMEAVAYQSVDPGGRERVRVVPTKLKGFGDPDLLEIVLRNLVSNAVKHSQGGRVLLGCRRIRGEIRIEVHDDGPGIPPDQLQRLFAEFVRGAEARSTEGLGLGLAIVERLAKLMDYPLSVRSEVGRGAMFGISIPRAWGAAASAVEPEQAGTLAGVRVLLADDEPLALDAMRRTLEDVGATVATAASAEAAGDLAGAEFDLLIFDLNLGGGDGLELLTELEADGRRRPALIITGATAPEALARLRRSGRTWLTKPVTTADLTAAATAALAESGPA